MKKIVKIIVAFALSAVLMCGNQQKARAQFVVSDPGSLIQMILDYLQEADMEGIFTDVSRLTASTEQLENLRERLSQLQQMASWVGTALQVSNELKAIVDISQAFAVSYGRVKTLAEFLYANDQGFNVAVAASHYLDDYYKVFNDFLLQAGDLFKQVKNISKAEALDFLASVTDLAEEFYRDFNAISSHFEMKMSRLYYKFARIEMAAANEAFLGVTIY